MRRPMHFLDQHDPRLVVDHHLRYRIFVHRHTDVVWCLLMCQLHGYIDNINTRNHLALTIFSRVILYVVPPPGGWRHRRY